MQSRERVRAESEKVMAANNLLKDERNSSKCQCYYHIRLCEL